MRRDRSGQNIAGQVFARTGYGVAGAAIAAAFGVLQPFAARAQSLQSKNQVVVSPAAASSTALKAAQSAVQGLSPDAAAALQRQLSLQQRNQQAIGTITSAQSAARAAAGNSAADLNNKLFPPVPNGLGAGGLLLSGGPDALVNAKVPVQSVAGGQTNVVVGQTAPKAIVNWQSFNIGSNTTLTFDQQGNTKWVALNRVADPSGVPSQILGRIKADGQVYLINRNGIIFGSKSQVNTQTLLASSLDFFSSDLTKSNDRFVNGGIGDLGAANSATNAILLTANTPGAGDIVIASGAQIATGDLGLALIAAPNVTNGGTVVAPDGQIALTAGVGVSYDYNTTSTQDPNTGNAQFLNDNSTNLLRFAGYGRFTDGNNPNPSTNDITPRGLLTNTGILQADRGNVTLLGGAVQQNGAVLATTSSARAGSIVISSQYEGENPALAKSASRPERYYSGPVTFGPGSVTAITPDTNGQTVPNDAPSLSPFQQKQVAASSGKYTIDSLLPTVGLGLINVTGQAVDIQGGSQVYAPGQNIAIGTVYRPDPRFGPVAGSGRVFVESGATLDVSGVADVQLPVASNLLTVTLAGNELADSPLQRADVLGLANGSTTSVQPGLQGLSITVDTRITGTNPITGQSWIGTPVANLTGYPALRKLSIDEVLTNGGGIDIRAAEADLARGSVLNLAGGYLHYLGGTIKTTRLLDSSGRSIDISQADPNDTYLGNAGLFQTDHKKWKITDKYGSLEAATGRYEPDYIAGGNAGRLALQVNNANDTSVGYPQGAGTLIFDGTVNAGAFAGDRQVQAGTLPAGGSLTLNLTSPVEIGSLPTLSPLSLSAVSLPAGFSLASPLLAGLTSDPAFGVNPYATTVLSDASIDSAHFANISIASLPLHNAVDGSITVDAGASLTVNAGGSISLSGSSAAIDGALVARAGSITVTTAPLYAYLPDNNPSGRIVSGNNDIAVGVNGRIDVSGLFVNDSFLSATPFSGPANLNGGSISLLANAAISAAGKYDPVSIPVPVRDYSGNIVLAAGSRLNISGGGRVLPAGTLQLKNGLPAGAGGSLTVSAYNADTGDAPLPIGPQDRARGQLVFDGSVDALGFNGGGALTLQTREVQVGGSLASAPANTFFFDPQVWGDLGFGSFNINAALKASVPSGAQIQLSHRNLIPDAAAVYTPGGGSPKGFSTPGTLPFYRRSPTNLTIAAGVTLSANISRTSTLTNGSLLIGEGTAITADPQAKIALSSPVALDILGSISAPGGSIGATVIYDSVAFYDAPRSVGALYLGPNSVLDVSGTTILNPLAPQVNTADGFVTPRTGTVLPGGAVSLAANFAPVLVAPGAVLNVSGASDAFDSVAIPTPGTAGLNRPFTLQRQPVWSDAGSVSIGAEAALLFDGRLIGNATDPRAKGGTLTLKTFQYDALASATSLTLVQNISKVLTAPGVTFEFATYDPALDLHPSGVKPVLGPRIGDGFAVTFGVDSLNGSGFGSLVLDGSKASDIGFSGAVNISLANSFISRNAIYGGGSELGFSIFNPPSSSTHGAALTVTAPYISFGGLDGSQPAAYSLQRPGDAVLNLNAKQLDISSSIDLYNIGEANFTSSGDIRLLPTAIPPDASTRQLQGFLYSTGNMTFKAAQIYPVTDTAYILEASHPSVGNVNPTTITFGYPNGVAASSATPLSAGGTLFVDAANIVQNGNIHVPFGSIVLGSSTPSAGDVLGFPSLHNYLYPGVITQNVSIGAGSVTSVSANGTVIPYGSTVDQTKLLYDPSVNNTVLGPSSLFATALAAPPSGIVTVTSQTIAFNKGAVIDLSGGGDLQAQEFIPGTGGSRDVLSQLNRTFPNGASAPVQTPLYSDNRQVFAILPGYSGAAAPFDAALTQPGGLTPLGSTGGFSAGQSVYLDGGPGLAAGTYTLLPGRYATLPGAFRVVQNTAYAASTPTPTVALPDGTLEVSGYATNALTGTASSTPKQFFVQSGPVWKQYSEFALTGANAFFPLYAAQQNIALPQLPKDSARLVLNASSALALDGLLYSTPAMGGRGAAVDITSRFIEITGAGETADAGYLGIRAATLDALGAESLLIGGVRSQGSNGTIVLPLAQGIIVANDAATPLQAPEILLTAAPELQSTDVLLGGYDRVQLPVAVANTGQIVIRSGSVIRTRGNVGPGAPATIDFGPDRSGLTPLPAKQPVNPDSSFSSAINSLITAYYGTLSQSLGSFVRVSNGNPVSLQIADQTLLNPGSIGFPVGTTILPRLTGGDVFIQTGASVLGGNALTIAGTGITQIDGGATLGGRSIQVDAASITFVSKQTNVAGNGLVIDPGTIVQLLNAQDAALRSHSTISFTQGDITLQLNGNASIGSLTLSGSALVGDGGNVSLSAPDLVLDNEFVTPPATFAAGTGALVLNAGRLVFGTGSKTLKGFGSVNATASREIAGQGKGVFDFGSLGVNFTTPRYIADTGSDQTLQTTSALSLAAAPAVREAAFDAVGGAIVLQGGSVNVAVPIQALAGNITVNATSGDVILTAGGALSVQGVAKQFYDVTKFASAGTITLSANNGSVILQQGSAVDFSGARAGGDGGSLTIGTANTVKPVVFDAVLSGRAAPGYTGSVVNLDSGAAVALDPLVQLLTGGGVTGGLTVRSGAGDLALSQVFAARKVALTADGGSINVSGTIDASGSAGGQIDLYGAGGVTLTGGLLARGSDANQRGGTVNLGTVGVSDGTLNSDGSSRIVSSGAITIVPGAVVDVSGGTFAGLSGGAVNIRSPILDAGANAGGVTVSLGGTVKGARDIVLEGYRTWTTQTGSGFDGTVGSGGLFDVNIGQATRFVQNFALTNASRFGGARLRPGVELVNGNASVNGGSITVISDLDLGQGSVDPLTGAFTGKFRVAATGEPGVLSLRAANNVRFESASISDGFYAFNTFETVDASALQTYLNALKQYELYLATKTAYDAALANYNLYPNLYDQYPGTGAPGSGAPNAPAVVQQPAPYNPTAAKQPLSLLQQSQDPATWGDSWSYRITGGSNIRGADPLGVSTRAGVTQQTANAGNVILTGHKLFTYNEVVGATPARFSVTGNTPYYQYGPGFDIVGDGTALAGLQNTDLPKLSYSAPGTGYTLTAVFAQPSLLRTGTGSIAIAAANDIALSDPQHPDPLGSAAIYTAGKPIQTPHSGYGASLAFGHSRTVPALFGGPGSTAGTGASTVLTAETNAEAGGDISFRAQRNILGVQNAADFSGITRTAGSFLGQYWTPWLLTNPANPKVPWYVNFGSFAQGVLSLGGNVTVAAGGDIRDLGVSLPTTAYLDAANVNHLTGGGVLSVTAGGNIFSGDYYVGRGSGSIKAGGSVASDFNYVSIDDPSHAYPVATLLAVQDAAIGVQARQSIDIGGVYDPTYIYTPTPSSAPQPPILDYTNLDPSPANGIAQSPVNLVPYVTGLTPTSGVAVQASSGDVTFNTLQAQGDLFDYGLQAPFSTGSSAAQISSLLLPSSLNLTALNGGIAIDHGGGLFPSASGSLSVIANGPVALAVPIGLGAGGSNSFPPSFTPAGNVFGYTLGKLDYPAGTGILPDASNPGLLDVSRLEAKFTHDPALALAGVSTPSRIYSLNGTIQDGLVLPQNNGNATTLAGYAKPGQTVDQIAVVPNGPTLIHAGLDILDLRFFGENFKPADITSIVAGRDIGFNPNGAGRSPILELAGPGTLDVQAGRNITFPSQRDPGVTNTGIRTIGNSLDLNANAYFNSNAAFGDVGPYLSSFGNPYLASHRGASASVLFGVGPGINLAGFANRYIDPSSADANTAYLATLTAFVQQYEQGLGLSGYANLTTDRAWAIFGLLPPGQQQLLIQQVFFQILDATGRDYNNTQSPYYRQYARGYLAIEDLFPAALGYTANNLGGGTNGANRSVATGNLDLRGSTIQTQQGGDISIFGPGGRILVGSSGASPAVDPASEGILTFEKGNISVFTDQDVLVAQSRIFTEQGGNIVMFTSNGSLDAGKGAKTSVSLPAPVFQCDITFACSKDEKGEVSGAGIGTLQSLADVPPGNIDLIAPRGKVDAGAAGIRVSGDLNIAALFVVNAFNIQVQGATAGIPAVEAPNITALAKADNTTAAAANEAGSPQRQAARGSSIIVVEIIGFGGSDNELQRDECPDGTSKAKGPCKEKNGTARQGKRVYNENSPVQVIGSGALADDQLQYLTTAERANLTPQN